MSDALYEVHEVPVTLCPPGKRSRDIAFRERADSGIPLTLAAGLTRPPTPSIVPPAKDDRRTAQERVEAALRADEQSVALAQPHRAGQLDARYGTPLGRWCALWWPGVAREPWRNKMWAAGEAYDRIVRDSKIALGLPYLGQSGGKDGEPLGEAQIEARKDLALMRRKRADEALREIKYALPGLMERFAYEQREPAPCDEDLLRHGLWKIADEFGMLEKGVHGRVDGVKIAC